MEILALEKNFTFDHIIDNLYLGDLESTVSTNLGKFNIKIVVNASNSEYVKCENITYFKFHIDDETNFDIYPYFEEFIKLINENPDKNILVHCQNSVSRSVTLTLAYLISKGMSLQSAYEYLISKRKQYTYPNRGFIKQLSFYEFELYGKISIDPIKFYKMMRK